MLKYCMGEKFPRLDLCSTNTDIRPSARIYWSQRYRKLRPIRRGNKWLKAHTLSEGDKMNSDLSMTILMCFCLFVQYEV